MLLFFLTYYFKFVNYRPVERKIHGKILNLIFRYSFLERVKCGVENMTEEDLWQL